MSTHQDQLRGFARYNREFNRRLFEQLSGLTDDERKKDMGAFFGSIHGTLNHILLADRIWLGRFAAAFPALSSLEGADLVHEFSSLRQQLYAGFEALHAGRRATDRVISDWVEELSDDLLGETMRYRNSRGDRREHAAWIAVAHMFNHQTHHRGQVTALMHQLGHDPGATDYLVYVQ
ncbi:DinB family protein [Marilutibacter chinensis]|uniref:DinB family protein n=1 Tax=Marilutibacter chinensis TaxID=2912247 RepID=A0ABS9HYY8_9GAMM|nr:DinB family protein [Lysobacter chinensis]MCF7223297.1 DinB family protein [Lysobacter chinensis]